uniref:Uncharacterized protein n=1 Tax=Arundo donax TaxID=35708 RepID=A0A0A9ABI8_ARUDO
MFVFLGIYQFSLYPSHLVVQPFIHVLRISNVQLLARLRFFNCKL